MKIIIEQPSVAAAINQEDLTNSIINNLNIQELSPLERYAIANMLNKAAGAAAKILSNAGLKHALRKPTTNDPNECYEMASKGKQFIHRGYVYGVTFHPEYNYAQPDAHGRDWVKTGNEIRDLQKSVTAKGKYKNALQSIILSEHNLSPINKDENGVIPSSLSFHPSGFSKDEDA